MNPARTEAMEKKRLMKDIGNLSIFTDDDKKMWETPELWKFSIRNYVFFFL